MQYNNIYNQVTIRVNKYYCKDDFSNNKETNVIRLSKLYQIKFYRAKSVLHNINKQVYKQNMRHPFLSVLTRLLAFEQSFYGPLIARMYLSIYVYVL